MSNFDTIQSDALVQVYGGADDGYNGGDVARAGAGALFGFLTGGPIGGVVGGGAGFMSRKVNQLADGVNDIMAERKRAAELEAKRQEILKKTPQPAGPKPNP